MHPNEWTSRIAALAAREHGSLADLIVALVEFDALAVYRQLGFASLFDFLHREIGLSRGSAYYRQVACRLVRRFPEVLEPIRDGRLCISNVSQLSKVMTEENRVEVLPRFFHRSKQEAKQVVVEIRPVEAAPTRTVVTSVAAHGTVQPVEPNSTHPERAMPEPPAERSPRTVVEPMSVMSFRVHITVSPTFIGLLKQAKAGESHRKPGATDEQVLTAALELLIAKQARRKGAVPARVKRAVMGRDQGRCQWPLAGGGICGSTARLEVDHVVPRGRGGTDTVENTRLLCRAHNLEAARRAYGDELMDRYAGAPGAPGGT